MNILQVNSAPASKASTNLTRALVARSRADNPGATLTVRDPSRAPHPPLDESTLQAPCTPADKRAPEHDARVALDDALIAEIQAADVVVGVPMYNFGAPAQLKNWIDDTQVPYLRTFFTFLGMTDVQFVYAEGLARGPEAEQNAFASARSQIEELTANEVGNMQVAA